MSKPKSLSEAAADVLNNSIARTRPQEDKFGSGTVLHKGPHQEIIDLGGPLVRPGQDHPDYTKGVPRATPPGQTPPVGSEPMHKLKIQPQEHEGREDLDKDPTDGKEEGVHDSEEAGTRKKVAPKARVREPVKENTDEPGETIAEILARYNLDNVEEDINAIFAKEGVSEEFLKNAKTIYEAAVNARVEAIALEMEKVYNQKLEEEVEEIKNQLSEEVEEYLDHVTDNWVKDNQVAIEKGLRAELVEDFISGLKQLFLDHYIDIPEEKVDLVDELTTKVQELESNLNEEIHRGVSLRKLLDEKNKEQTIATVSEGLTKVQAEKLKTLAEQIKFVDEEDYTKQVQLIKENYFGSKVVTQKTNALDETDVIEDKKETRLDPRMSQYVNSISKTLLT